VPDNGGLAQKGVAGATATNQFVQCSAARRRDELQASTRTFMCDADAASVHRSSTSHESHASGMYLNPSWATCFDLPLIADRHRGGCRSARDAEKVTERCAESLESLASGSASDGRFCWTVVYSWLVFDALVGRAELERCFNHTFSRHQLESSISHPSASNERRPPPKTT